MHRSLNDDARAHPKEIFAHVELPTRSPVPVSYGYKNYLRLKERDMWPQVIFFETQWDTRWFLDVAPLLVPSLVAGSAASDAVVLSYHIVSYRHRRIARSEFSCGKSINKQEEEQQPHFHCHGIATNN